ncbi:MAG TPA: PIG-L family deacetylase [Candidatus Dormibacteraeota bacterium]|jgi:LmbE family N-acetylglucosaminyl deacetylase|nr:PIG-L family deacetylase [Candidatus Dormibacteraeota bacterium]
MESKPGLLVVMAHPDDESMGCGGLILRHTRAGIPVHLICATRGEAGWSGKPIGAKREDLAQIRTQELDEAAAALAISGVELWDYTDGGVEKADPQEITQRIWEQITRLHPKAVVGWGPDGGYGHPDHIAVGASTDVAVTSMAEGDRPALYHIAVDRQTADFYKEAARLAGDGQSLPLVVTDHVDVAFDLDSDEVMMKLRAIDCHRSQLEDWRITIREHPRLLQEGYGHEPYLAIASRTPALAPNGLLGEFA